MRQNTFLDLYNKKLDKDNLNDLYKDTQLMKVQSSLSQDPTFYHLNPQLSFTEQCSQWRNELLNKENKWSDFGCIY